MVRVALHLPGVTTGFREVEFIVDTGASITVLQPADAKARVGIPPATLDDPDRWPTQSQHRGVGGMAAFYVQPTEYSLQHEDGRWQAIRGSIALAQPTPHKQQMRSLLGWDVLQYFVLRLDWARSRVRLS